MAHPKKLVVSDVDGTILTSTGEIDPMTVEGIEKLQRAGHIFSLASARSPRSLQTIAGDLRLERARAPFISLNGALTFVGSEVVWERRLEREALQAVIERARSRGFYVNLYAGWEWFFHERNEWSRWEAEMVGFEPVVVEDLTRVDRPVHKMLVVGDNHALDELNRWIIAEGLPLHPAFSKSSYLEIVAKGVSKGEAVCRIAEHLGVALEDVIAFGDGDNDVEMLRTAGVGVAMGNATDRLKRVAQRTTLSNDQLGVVKALRELGLIE